MPISRKENGSLVKKAGIGIIDKIMNKYSNNAVSNKLFTETIEQINNDLTANSNKFEASYQNGKYGFIIDGTFYEIGGSTMRVVKTGSGTTSNDSPVTIQLGETIPVDKYFVLINSDVGYGGNGFTGCVRLETKTTTSFTLKAAHSNNTAYGYQVIAFN